MDDFPRRMRDWLFNIMRDLAARHELSPHYLKLEKEAEVEQSKRWANAAIWKFCDLDGHPHDRYFPHLVFFFRFIGIYFVSFIAFLYMCCILAYRGHFAY